MNQNRLPCMRVGARLRFSAKATQDYISRRSTKHKTSDTFEQQTFKNFVILFLFQRLGRIESESGKSYNKPGKEVMEMAVETITPGHHVPEHAWEHTALRTELLLALGAVVLSILGLARVFPMYLTAISIIALGAVLLFQGATVAWHFSDLLHQAGASKAGVAEVGGGITTEFIAGIAGIVLGVLALVGIVPMTLLSVGVITYSATLLMTSGEAAWLHSFEAKDDEMMRHLMYFMTSAAAGAQVLVGLAGLVLGILALVGIAPTLMVLVGVLTIGASVVLRSSAVGGFLLKFLHM